MQSLTFPFITITLFVTFVLPIVFSCFYVVKNKETLKPLLFGALSFFVMQIVLRIPLLNVLPISKLPVLLQFATLALTAGIFETVGRLLVFKVLIKQPKGFKTGFATGLGHGCFEALFIVGINYLNLFVFALLLLSNETVSIPGAELVVNVLTTTPSISFLFAGIERVFTVFLHIALSLLLLYFINKGKTVLGCVVVTLIHSTVDFVIPLTLYYTNNIFISEALVALVGVGSIILILKLKQKYASISKDFDITNAEKMDITNDTNAEN